MFWARGPSRDDMDACSSGAGSVRYTDGRIETVAQGPAARLGPVRYEAVSLAERSGDLKRPRLARAGVTHAQQMTEEEREDLMLAQVQVGSQVSKMTDEECEDLWLARVKVGAPAQQQTNEVFETPGARPLDIADDLEDALIMSAPSSQFCPPSTNAPCVDAKALGATPASSTGRMSPVSPATPAWKKRREHIW